MGNSRSKPANVQNDATNKAKEEEKAAIKKEKERVDAIVKKQLKIQRQEINQTWTVVFGDEEVKKKNIHVIKNITVRNIWMEELYLFNAVKELKPDEVFHPADSYVMKWKPPGSYHQLIIPLADYNIQESVVMEIAKYRKSLQKKLIFCFVPLVVGVKMFAEKVHPAALVEFKSKNSVLRKISEIFLEGKIPISDLQQIFTGDYDLWKVSLFNLLPPDWQEYHEYLNVPPVAEVTEADYEKKYINDEITLREYEDFKYPDRKELNDLKSLQYPLTPEYTNCIICGESTGIIKCQNCDNKVCVRCVRAVFLDDVSGEGSFMLMHHKYCLRLGSLKPIKLELLQEPAYLRQFRATTRSAAIARFSRRREDAEFGSMGDEDGDESEDEEERAAAEAERRRLEEQRLRMERENPPELVEMRSTLEQCAKKYLKLLKEAKLLKRKIEDPGHTDQFIARNQRLLQEAMDKIAKVVQNPVQKIQTEALALGIIGNPLQSLLTDAEKLLAETARVLSDDPEIVRAVLADESTAAAGAGTAD